MISRKTVADKLLSYIQGGITLIELVHWAESSLMDANFESGFEKEIAEVLGRIGLIDVNNFGLSWQDCDMLIHKLGYSFKIDLVT